MSRGRKPDSLMDRRVKADRKRTRESDDRLTTSVAKPETIAVDAVSSAEWDRMVELLDARGTLSQADVGVLVCYCDAYSRLVACRRTLAEEGPIVSTELGAAKAHPLLTAASIAARDLRAAAADLGATPMSRSRVTPEQNPEGDELDSFLGGITR